MRAYLGPGEVARQAHRRRVSARQRERRRAIFLADLPPARTDRSLDLGSEDGSHIAHVLGSGYDVFIADIDHEALERGSRRYGFTPVVIPEDGVLPFADGSFDVRQVVRG